MSVFRVYEPDECGPDGYPFAWHDLGEALLGGVKDAVRAIAGHRCVRCQHPYLAGQGEWSSCDLHCMHGGPTRIGSSRIAQYAGWNPIEHADRPEHVGSFLRAHPRLDVEARWRILTVHHLRLGDDAKRDLRWWNLAALCQRCHLQIQSKVQMERIWPWPHSEWFKPYAAGWYAWAYLGEDLTREEVEARLDELLGLELAS